MILCAEPLPITKKDFSDPLGIKVHSPRGSVSSQPLKSPVSSFFAFLASLLTQRANVLSSHWMAETPGDKTVADYHSLFVCWKTSLCFSFLFKKKISMGFLRARLRDRRLMNFDSCVASLSCLAQCYSMSLSRQHYRIGKALASLCE